MKSFTGNGRGSAKEAVEEATQGLKNPSLIIFSAPYEKIGEMASLLSKKYPGVPSMGTIGVKIVNGAVSDDSLAITAFFEDARVGCGLVTDIERCPVASIGQIQRKLAAVSPGKEDTVCIEFCTGAEEKMVTTFTSCLGKKDIPLAGGTAFGMPDGEVPVVAYNGRIYRDSCVYAFVKNTKGKAKVYKENIYVNKSDKAHFATKVDVKRKALIELDGRPAADVYSDELSIPKDKIIDNVFVNPIGRTVGDQVFISSMLAVEQDGTIVNFKRINKNDCVYFLSLGDYEQIGKNTREKIKGDFKRVSFVFSIDCAYRYQMYEQKGYISAYAKDMAALGMHMGIVAGGEQYRNQHANQTMVCAVFE